MWRRWTLALVAVALGALTLTQLRAATALAEDDAKDLEKAVTHVMTTLRKNKKGLRIGMTNAQAARAAKGAAMQSGEYVIPLAATVYAPPGEWHGVLTFFVDSDEPRAALDTLDVALLCESYDKAAMGRTIARVGRKLGLKLENDEDEPLTYMDAESTGNDLWISLGDGVIYLSVNMPFE